MGTTLDNGTYLPDEGERNCYEGLAGNWVALDNHLGSTNIHVTINDKQAWDGHIADSVKHVTAEDKAKWDAVTGKANDADVVHKSGTETVGGKKTFTDELTASKNATNGALNLQNSSYDPKTNGQSAIGSTKSFAINVLTSTSDLFSAVSFYGASDRTIIRFTTRYYTDSQNFDYDSLEYTLYGDGTRSFRPRSNNNTTLGESSRKWKDLYTNQINSLTPSSLSLPDFNNSVDISGYVTNLSGYPNDYVAPSNGFISISATGTGLSMLISGADLGVSLNRATSGSIKHYIPILKGQTVRILIIASSLEYVKFFPCQGNL